MSEIPSSTVFEEDILSVGKLIQKRRDDLGLSQKETADRAEISLSALKQYETDRSHPPLDKAIRLADVLNINPHSFFDELGVPDVSQAQGNRSPDAQLLKVLTELSSAVGATVSFDNPLDSENFGEVNIHCDSLEKLRNLVEWKGLNSRHMPSTLADAEAALWNLDLDEIEALGAEAGLPENVLLEAPVALSLKPRERDARCKTIIPRILIATVYGPIIETLGKDELEFIAQDLAKQCFNRNTSIEGKAWLSETHEGYLERLRSQISDELKEAISKGRPYEFSEEYLQDENSVLDQIDTEQNIENEGDQE